MNETVITSGLERVSTVFVDRVGVLDAPLVLLLQRDVAFSATHLFLFDGISLSCDVVIFFGFLFFVLPFWFFHFECVWSHAHLKKSRKEVFFKVE